MISKQSFLTRDSFRAAAHEVGLGERMALARFDSICESFPQALNDSAEELTASGFPGCNLLRDQILLRGGYHNLIHLPT